MRKLKDGVKQLRHREDVMPDLTSDAALKDMSRQAQAAENRGDNLMATMLHEGINRSLDERRGIKPDPLIVD